MTKYKHVHFIGIGGYGMSAIARVLLDLGCSVSGSDLSEENRLVKGLIDRGAIVSNNHSKDNIDSPDIVVYSTSIKKTNIERVTALEKGIETIHRSEMLAKLLNHRQGIAVAGAHGKTTTSSMIAQTLELCNQDPTYIIGGEIVGLKGNAKAGSSDYVVAEADESDGSFLEYYPYLAVITNIEADHLENYNGDFNQLKDAYKQFLSQIVPGGKAVLCVDDQYTRELCSVFEGNAITYGIDYPADYTATNIRSSLNCTRFTVKKDLEVLGDVELTIPGKHNINNALAAIIVCLDLGVDFSRVSKALGEFQGAKRRFQIVGEVDNILVIDDYAHHPTEIKATLEGAKTHNKRMIVVFQPQRYSRTHLLMNEFSCAFELADEVIINKLYAPEGEDPIPGVNSERLTELIIENSNKNTRYIEGKEEVIEYLLDTVTPNDMVLTLGAGDIWRVSHGFYNELKISRKKCNNKIQ